MLYALELAERGRLSTAPNPWVGCVIVAADGATVLAEGYHQRKGGPHAEAAALADAKARGVSRAAMEGATAYVTLEPCTMGPGKSTPACDAALVASGLRNVHLALLDPDPTFGGGADFLRANGIAVTVGAGAAAVLASLRPYLYQRRTGKPWVVLKVASSADGAIACADGGTRLAHSAHASSSPHTAPSSRYTGTSQWITGESARAHSQVLRASSQAIMVGSGTAVADKPKLTVRLADGALPDGWLPPSNPLLRVVLDASGRVTDGPLLDTSAAPTLVFTTAAAAGEARDAWRAAGVEAVEVPAAGPSGGVDLEAVLIELGSRGVIQLMVEGGGQLHGAFLAERRAQQFRLYVGACALGSSAQRWMQAPLAATIEEAQRWRLSGVEVLGDDVCVDYDVDEGDGVGGEESASAATGEGRSCSCCD